MMGGLKPLHSSPLCATFPLIPAMHYISARPRNALHPLIPAKAGIQFLELPDKPDSRLRGNERG